MDKTSIFSSDLIQMIVTVLCSGALFTFIQFLITRKDKKIEDEKVNRDEEIRKELKQHLADVNNQWKENYCDKNSKALEDMKREYKENLEDIKEAIRILTENDRKITDSLERMTDKQEVIAASLIGQAHDRIIYLTDKITKRGGITNKEKATLRSMFEPYSDLGGNGEVEEAFKYVMSLTTITEKEAIKRDTYIRCQEYQEMRDFYDKKNEEV